MSAAASMIEQFRQLPRAIQWAAIAAMGIVLFLVWDQQLRPLSDQMDRAAERIEGQVSEVRAAQTVIRDLQNLHDVVVSMGPVTAPGSEAEGNAALNDLVNEILQKHGATNQTFGSRSRGKLGKNALPMLARGKRIDLLTGDLKFDASQDAAVAIIAALESSPDIESVKSVRINRDAAPKVKVHLLIEAWVLSSEVSSGGPTS